MDRVSGLPEVPRSEPILSHSSHDLPPTIPSSPPSIASEMGSGRRQRKPPTVTPRSFRRFFTPRSLLNSGNNGSSVKTNRQALRTLNSPAVNRLGPAFTRTSKAGSARSPDNGLPEDLIRTPTRKRKHSFSSTASPLQSSPLKKVRVRSPAGDEVEHKAALRDIDLSDRGRMAGSMPPSPVKRRPVSPVKRSNALQTSGALFMRTLRGSRANRLTVRSTAGAGSFSPTQVKEFELTYKQAGKISHLTSIRDQRTATLVLAMLQRGITRFHFAMLPAIVSIHSSPVLI